MVVGAATITGLAAAGCRPAEELASAPHPSAVPAELQKYVLAQLPSDVGHRTLLDFDTKVQLVGYDASPSAHIARGEVLHLRLYWRVTGSVEPGFRLVTTLLNEGWYPLPQGQFSDVGPLRTLQGDSPVFGLNQWQVGKIYVDEQDLRIPEDAEASRLTVGISIEKVTDSPLPAVAPAGSAVVAPVAKFGKTVHRLRLVNGPSAGAQRGALLTLTTDYVPPSKSGEKDEKVLP